MSPRRLLLASLLALCACKGPQKSDPASAPGSQPGAAQPGAPEPTVGRFTTHWDLLNSRYGATYGVGESFAQPCYHTDRFRLDLLCATDGGLPPPAEAAAEVLIAVEGSGMLELSGQATPLAAGTVAILPAGARGVLRGSKQEPLKLLAIRVRGAVTPEGQPLLLTFEQLWQAPGADAPDVATRWVGGVGSAISLETLEVRGDGSRRGFIPPHARKRRDELMFLLSGGGSLGLANSGNLLAAGSVVGIPAGTVSYYSNNDPNGTLALVVRVPAVDPKQPRDDEEMVPTDGR